ncbi:MAG TPA: hypothetical protein PK668_25670 [Myxococcota bacterium]|nr:hypothetical protein [Myxococcota bacterium]HRY96917.1 hypothetical protein [Myxococcota bacterium]HSA22038.1 hypothetical protein [Myxococcota bacterium]
MRGWLAWIALLGLAGCATSTASRSYEADRMNVRLLERPPSMVAAYPASNLVVDASKPWQDTGVRVPRGAQVVVKAQGSWSDGPEEPGHPGPEPMVRNARGVWRGWPEDLGCFGPEGVVARPGQASQPGPEVPWITPLALMGRLGPDGRPFEIGLRQAFQAEEEGELFLAINDSHLSLESNHGSLSVRVIVLAPGSAPAP